MDFYLSTLYINSGWINSSNKLIEVVYNPTTSAKRNKVNFNKTNYACSFLTVQTILAV